MRWATSLGGPGPDGCNEVAIGADGSIVTSIDTAGGWDSPAGPLPGPNLRDTLLLSLDDAGEVRWGRQVGGDGSQRGKSLAVGPDGSIAFGGDSVGALVIDGRKQPVPGPGPTPGSRTGPPTATSTGPGPGAAAARTS